MDGILGSRFSASATCGMCMQTFRVPQLPLSILFSKGYLSVNVSLCHWNCGFRETVKKIRGFESFGVYGASPTSWDLFNRFFGRIELFEKYFRSQVWYSRVAGGCMNFYWNFYWIDRLKN